MAFADQPKFRPSDEERGEDLYRKHCVQCHGVRNRGDGPIAAVLTAPVPNLQGKIKTKGPQVETVLWGKGHMPGFEATFHKQDAVRVLKYQASLGAKKSLRTAAEKARVEADKKKKESAKKRQAVINAKKKKEELAEGIPEGPEREGDE